MTIARCKSIIKLRGQPGVARDRFLVTAPATLARSGGASAAELPSNHPHGWTLRKAAACQRPTRQSVPTTLASTYPSRNLTAFESVFASKVLGTLAKPQLLVVVSPGGSNRAAIQDDFTCVSKYVRRFPGCHIFKLWINFAWVYFRGLRP
jgi:hypothetical protein